MEICTVSSDFIVILLTRHVRDLFLTSNPEKTPGKGVACRRKPDPSCPRFPMPPGPSQPDLFRRAQCDAAVRTPGAKPRG